MNSKLPFQTRHSRPLLLALIAFCLLLCIYFVIRFEGRWSETDTAVLARLIRIMVQEGRLIPQAETYAQGYGYPVIATTLVHLTGVDVTHFQLILAPLLVTWLILPAWLFYREVAGSSHLATLGVAFLLVQPEFLFVVLRSSHEKFARGFMFLSLFILFRSLRPGTKPRTTALLIPAFYLTNYALITTNSFLAASFIVTIAIAYLAISVLGRIKTTLSPRYPWLERRLLSITLTSAVLAFLFIFYLYEPAQINLQLVQSIWQGLGQLILSPQAQQVNPYSVIGAGWISLPAYLVISSANWLLLLASVVAWNYFGYQLLLKSSPKLQSQQLLWVVFGAFTLLGILAATADTTGGIAGNLQQRAFPTFTMLAVPMIIIAVSQSFLVHRLSNPAGATAVLAVLGILALFALLKVTHEQKLSNNWILYLPGELRAVQWFGDEASHATIWTDYNERVNTVTTVRNLPIPEHIELDAFTPDQSTTDYLNSSLISARGLRLGRSHPAASDTLRIYDNGQAHLLHRRPQTPYQR
jgi:hypothetical protein